MRKMMKTGMVFFMAMMVLMVPVTADAKAKVLNKRMTIDLNKDSAGLRFALTKLKKYSKVKVSVKNKKVLKAKVKGRKYIYLKGKAGGRTTMTIRLYKGHKKVRVYRYSIKVIGKGQDGYKAQEKKAFAIQNRYRAEKGAKALKWSDELYRFAQYRLRHSGYDRHENLQWDMQDYYGDMLVVNNISLGENMASGQTDAKNIMTYWKHSPGHYSNLLNKDYQCGAIARYKSDWCAIFYNGSSGKLKKNEKSEIVVTVKRLDKASGQCISGVTIGYYEENDRWNTSKRITVGESGRRIVLELGKTYVFYEKTTPDGYDKAEKVTITATKDMPGEIILSDN